jgi:hypothetical protein
MPLTIPNLLLHDKPVRLANMRSLGQRRLFVYCSNPGCHHNAELDVDGLPDEVTFNDLQLAWSAPSAIIGAPMLDRLGATSEWPNGFRRLEHHTPIAEA